MRAIIFTVFMAQYLATTSAFIAETLLIPRPCNVQELSWMNFQPTSSGCERASSWGIPRGRGVQSLQLNTRDYLDDEETFEDTAQRLTQVLEEDLPRQYEKPQDLSIFSDAIEFRDPVTTLRGKLLYRGMLFTTLLFFRVACKSNSSFFRVTTIDRPGKCVIRTIWETGATTWNGRELFISGVDKFTVDKEGKISRHDSEWDQTWEEVRDQIS